ncbi:MAG: hypothetical protein HZA50_06545 [Planctomycetes bacterium]|nr:hypothetical protein [Planctomycetota bacterium]
MNRRIMMLAGSFIVLLATFGIYKWVASYSGDRAKPVDGGSITPMTSIAGDDNPKGIAKKLRVEMRDEKGRLEAIYISDEMRNLSGGRMILTKPDITLFHKDGRRTYVTANKGEVQTEEVVGKSGFNARGGTLEGNVKIFFDRRDLSAEDLKPLTERAKPPEQRPEELVRVYSDYIRFSRDMLNIETDSQVTVWSAEVNLDGKGLFISWNENPRELRLLRMDQGQFLAVKNVPEEFDVIALPSGQMNRQIGSPASGPAASPASRPATQSGQPATAAAASSPTTAAGVPATAVASRPAAMTASAPASKPASAPAEVLAAKPAAVLARNTYVAQFNDEISVQYGRRSMSGAKELIISFEWDQKGLDFDRGKAGRPATMPATMPAHATTLAASLPASSPASASAPTGGPANAKTPAKKRAGEILYVTWSGPLIIKPSGRTEHPTLKRYVVWASGEHVVLNDDQAQAVCREVIYESPAELGRLVGTPASPARLTLAQGEQIVCQFMRFDRTESMANLDGPGYMIRPLEERKDQKFVIDLPDSGGTRSRAESSPASGTSQTQPGSPGEPGSEKVTWTQGVEIRFREHRYARPDGTAASRQYINYAQFFGDVELTQAKTGDMVRCQKLEVWTEPGQGTQLVPNKATASGRVMARQDTSDIQAEKVTLMFRQKKEQTAAGMERLRIIPSELFAEGNVRVSDRRDADILYATADSIASKIEERQATLIGKPARIEQGKNSLAGDQIQLYEKADPKDAKNETGSVVVVGKGSLHFLTKKDLDGTDLPAERPVKLTWTDRMDYKAQYEEANFVGNVALVSDTDEMYCQRMILNFEKLAGATRPAAETGPAKPPNRRLAMNMESYSGRRLKTIEAEKGGDRDVLLRRRLENANREIVNRMQVRGAKLNYDNKTGIVEMSGSGNLLSEDYRPPEKTDLPQADQGPFNARLERPSQTYMEWQKRMVLYQNDREGVLEGKVGINYYSGNQVVLLEKLRIPVDVASLTTGRKSMLRCDLAKVKFLPPPSEKEGGRPVAPAVMQTGLKIGQLESFEAMSGVNLSDGPRQMMGEMLILDRTDGGKGVVTIRGYLPGRPRANATFINKDPASVQTVNSPIIRWYMDTNRIETEGGVEGAGGR